MPPAFHRLGLLLGACLLASCGRPDTAPARSRGDAPARTVEVARVEQRPMERTVTATGTLAAQEASTLSAKVAGRLMRLTVDIGSVVRQGEVIAQLEPRDFELRVQQASAALAQTRAELGLPLEGENDRVELETISSVRQAKAVRDEAAKNRERILNLSQTGIASQAELDTSDANFTVAQMRFEAALEAARARMATLAQRRAEYDIARKQYADSTVSAPYDGAIQTRPASPGEYVATGTPIVTLVKTDPLRLRLDVSERDSGLVRSGQTVRLETEGSTNVFTGRIARLSPALNPQSRMLRVEADVPNPGALRPGLFARAQIVVNEHEARLSIPLSALSIFAGIEKVVTLQEGKAKEITITTGRRGSDWIEVISGVRAGTPVVLHPEGLRSGQAVTVTNPAPESAESAPRGNSGS